MPRKAGVSGAKKAGGGGGGKGGGLGGGGPGKKARRKKQQREEELLPLEVEDEEDLDLDGPVLPRAPSQRHAAAAAGAGAALSDLSGSRWSQGGEEVGMYEDDVAFTDAPQVGDVGGRCG